MALLSHNYSFIFIFSFAFILPFITCVPLPDNPYDTFIDFLLENNCTMPKEVKIPFQTPSDPSPFSYLLTPLKECRTRDAVKDNDEATLLCKEVFDVLQNITCIEYNKPLSTIESNILSENVCADFRNMQAVFPKRNDYLSNKLVDDIICKIFCTKERYELLCKTLLWSYDIQAKIENVLENEDKQNEKADSHEVSGKDAVENQEKKTEKGDNHDVSAKNSLVVANSVVSDNIEPKNQEPSKDTNKPATSVNLHTEKEILPEKPDLSNPELSDKKSSSGLRETTLETTSNKIHTSTSKYQVSNVSKVPDISKNENVLSQDESKIKNKELSHQEKVEDSKNLEPKESNSLINQNVIDDKKNEIDEKHPDKMKETDHVPEVKSDTNTKSSPSNNNNMQEDQNVKNVSEDTSKNNVNSDITAKTNSKSEESVVPNPEMDNELNNKNFEESETKPKETDLKAPVDKDKDVNKPELTDFESPNEASPDTDSKLPESSTLQMLPDEDEHQQDDKDQDPYNASFNLSPKSKEPAIKSSIAVDSNQPPNNYFISTGNNIGRIPDDIAVIPPFPEQEDSHFFFYFLSIVLILMAGYLIFHNKQKIIALIVEGRHERRRRSHGAGYKKLETK